jgi:hypothetical protein
MNVGQLIELLQEYDTHAEVVVEGPGGAEFDVDSLDSTVDADTDELVVIITITKFDG